MRHRYAPLLALAMVGTATSADGPRGLPKPPVVPNEMPPAPTPTPAPSGVIRLSGDALYVADFDEDCVLRVHPTGLVKVSKEQGPIRIRAKFADGTGFTETRTYHGKTVFVVEAVGTGRVEMDVIPLGLKSEADIKSATVDVDAGQAPQPPPPKPVAAVAWIVVVEETEDRAGKPAIAALLSDTAYWKGLEYRGVQFRFYDKDSPDVKAKKYLRDHPLPYVLLLDAQGRDARGADAKGDAKPRPIDLPADKAGVDALLGGK